MIALAAIILLIVALRVVFIIRMHRNRIPTDKEVNDLQNRLNRLALKRGNK